MLETIITAVVGAILGFVVKYIQDYFKMKEVREIKTENLKLKTYIEHKNLKRDWEEFEKHLANKTDKELIDDLNNIFKK